MADNPIDNLKANEGLPNLEPADPKPLILPNIPLPQVPTTPQPKDNPPPPPLPIKTPTPAPTIMEKPAEDVSTIDPITPTLVDRGINEAPAAGQGFTPQQELNRVVAPDVQRQINAERELNQRIDNTVENTTQEMVFPALYKPTEPVDLFAKNAAAERMIYNNAVKSDAAMQAADAAKLTAAATPQRTTPQQSAFSWLDYIISNRQEGARNYINVNGNVLGPLLYGMGLAQNSVVGAYLDVRTQMTRAVNAFVPPWLKDNAIGALSQLDQARRTNPIVGALLTPNPVVEPFVNSLRSLTGFSKATEKLNDGKSNFIEALRGAQYSFSDKASEGGVGVANNVGFRVGAAPGKGFGVDVNPSVLAGVALDVVLGGKVDKLLGRAVRKVIPKAVPEAGQAAARAVKVSEPVPPKQLEIPFIPVTSPKQPVKVELTKEQKAVKAAFNRANRKEVARQEKAAVLREAERQRYEQGVLPVGDLVKTYEQQQERIYGRAVKLTPKQESAQLTLPIKVESKVPPRLRLPVSPALKKELAARANVTPQKVDQFMLAIPETLRERTIQTRERIKAFTENYPTVGPVRKGEDVRQGTLPLGDKLGGPVKEPRQNRALMLANNRELRRQALEQFAPEIRQLEFDYRNWLKEGEDSAQIPLELDIPDTVQQLVLDRPPETAAQALDRLGGMLPTEDAPTLPIDWNTRFPEVLPPVPDDIIPIKYDVIDTTKRTHLVDAPPETLDATIVPPPEALTGTPDLPQLPEKSSGTPSYRDYRMNLRKRDTQQLALPLDVPRVKPEPLPPNAQKYVPRNSGGRQQVLFTAVQGDDGITYRATKTVREAVDPPVSRPPTPQQRQGAIAAVEAASQHFDDTPVAERVAQLSSLPPKVDVVRELDRTLVEMPEVIGGTPEVQAVADLHNAKQRAQIVNAVAGSAKQKLDEATANLKKTADIGRQFTTERFSVPRARYDKPRLSLSGQSDELDWYHGTRVQGMDFAKADPILGGSRSELGLGHYLTSDPSVAESAALSDVSRNLPHTEGREWGNPTVHEVALRKGDLTIGGRTTDLAMTAFATQVGAAFPELEGKFTGALSLVDVYDIASKNLSEAQALEFQRHMAAALLESGYRRVRTGNVMLVIDGTGLKSKAIRELQDVSTPSAAIGHRQAVEANTLAETESEFAAAALADTEVRHAAQTLDDLQPIMDEVDAEVMEAVDKSGFMDDPVIQPEPKPTSQLTSDDIYNMVAELPDSPERDRLIDIAINSEIGGYDTLHPENIQEADDLLRKLGLDDPLSESSQPQPIVSDAVKAQESISTYDGSLQSLIDILDNVDLAGFGEGVQRKTDELWRIANATERRSNVNIAKSQDTKVKRLLDTLSKALDNEAAAKKLRKPNPCDL